MSKKYAKVNVVVGKVQELTEEQQDCDVLCVTMFQDEKDKKIADLGEQLALTEKAFELACKYGAFDTDILLREAQEELKNG